MRAYRADEPARTSRSMRAAGLAHPARAVSDAPGHPLLNLQHAAGNQAVVGLVPGGSTGRPLPATDRAHFERLFGAEFSAVRVHTGPAAARAAARVPATAYTIGNEIVIGADPAGPDTLAHELAHVLQQRGGGSRPGPAHEAEAEAAGQAVAAGHPARVNSRSGVGLAAQPRDRRLAAADLALAQPGLEDVTTVTYAELEGRIARVLKAPGRGAAEGRRAFSADPRTARAQLYHSHFRDDDERLSFALGYFQAALGVAGDRIDPEELHAALLNYEVEMQGRQVDVVVHNPPTTAELIRADDVRAEHDRQDYQAFLAEVKRLNDEADKRTLVHGGVYSGAATMSPLDYYVGAPVQHAAETLLHLDNRHLISLMVDFVPIVGQLKAVAEAIIGRDLITGDELATWQRGLGLLLAIIPEAKGIFSAGRAGMQTLARAAVESSQTAEEVYRATRLASRLGPEEVAAARTVAGGGRATPAQVKLATTLAQELSATGRRRRIFQKTTTTADPSLPAGEGFTTSYGDITYSTKGTAAEVALVRNHELVHSVLSPKLSALRRFRAGFGQAAYDRSQLVRYLEEALAESYAQLAVRGIRGLPEGIAFPITHGYVTLRGVVTEAAIGTVVYGGIVYGVYVVADNHVSHPDPAAQATTGSPAGAPSP